MKKPLTAPQTLAAGCLAAIVIPVYFMFILFLAVGMHALVWQLVVNWCLPPFGIGGNLTWLQAFAGGTLTLIGFNLVKWLFGKV